MECVIIRDIFQHCIFQYGEKYLYFDDNEKVTLDLLLAI